MEIRLIPVQQALAGGLPKGLDHPTHVLAQTWLTDPMERHHALARLLDQLPEGTVTAYLDTFANSDIRLAAVFPNIDYYFKKSLFVDPSKFLKPTKGHTNLWEYYGPLYNFSYEVMDWNIPAAVLNKLRLAPNFLTDPTLTEMFLGDTSSPFSRQRHIDLHARLGGTSQEGWYGETRRHAARVVQAMTGLNVVAGTGVSRQTFLEEMRQSKLCFSPFGHGEVCWRDIEAIATGALLVKPDMSHLRTEPDLFRDGETYIACRWDYADLGRKVSDILADDDRRQRIVCNAWETARNYLAEAGPVSTYAALFTSN